jgi:hypothetical protein
MALAIGLLGSKEMLGNCMERIFPMLPAAGITAFHDMGIWAPSLPEGYLGFEMLLEWEKAGKLPCRVAGVYGIRDAGEMPGPHVAALAQWRKKYRSDLVRVTGLKIWADGTFSTYTGVQLEPYASKPETRGESGWTAEVLGRWIDAAYAAGFDVHIHVQGDGSVRRSLDAFEAVARKRGPAGRRSVLHHLDVIHPDDLPRFKTLGLGGNATLEWLRKIRGQGTLLLFYSIMYPVPLSFPRQMLAEDWAGTVTFDGQSLRAQVIAGQFDRQGPTEKLKGYLSSGRRFFQDRDTLRESEGLPGSVAVNQEPFETLKIGHG